MNRIIQALPSLTLALLINWCAIAAYSQANIYGTITAVRDGQTVELTSGGNKFLIHLQGFEAPVEGQELEEIVFEHLKKLAMGKPAQVRVSRITGSTVNGFVFIGEMDLAAQMLRDGAGWLMLDDANTVTGQALADYQTFKTSHCRKSVEFGVFPDLSHLRNWRLQHRRYQTH